MSDAELARSVGTGSLDALGELYGRYADDVYTTALRLVGSEADAEDVLQDVFVGLPLSMSRYEERGAFGPWLRRVAARTALMRLRRAGESASPGPPSAEAAAPARDPVVRVAAGRAIAGLPASLRAVFVLKEVEGYSHDEIGALLDIRSMAVTPAITGVLARTEFRNISPALLPLKPHKAREGENAGVEGRRFGDELPDEFAANKNE